MQAQVQRNQSHPERLAAGVGRARPESVGDVKLLRRPGRNALRSHDLHWHPSGPARQVPQS